MSELIGYRENIEKCCEELEIQIENETDSIIICNIACKIAEYYVTLCHTFVSTINWNNKIHKYYLIAIDYKCLVACYKYGEWLNKRNTSKMCIYFSLAIEMYYNSDYITFEDDEYDLDYIENKVTRMLEILGNYYDSINNPTDETNENIIRYHELAIERGSVNSMFNLGHYYYECNDYINMFKYYLMAVELKDVDTMFELAIYYQNIQDFDNMRKYYLMALEEKENPDYNKEMMLNDGKRDFDLFILKEELEKIENKSVELIRVLQEINCIEKIMIFENKKKVFASLNYIIECGICYETKLHINLHCGHCCCIDCYPKIYKKPCPYCRL
jgi:tetratricopeptide (TPR) repeat protein